MPPGCDIWVKDYTGESNEDQSQNFVELLGRKTYFSAMFTRSKENVTSADDHHMEKTFGD